MDRKRKQSISARVEENILKDSKAVAKLENRSFNNLLETALIAYCKGKLYITYLAMISCDKLVQTLIKIQ